MIEDAIIVSTLASAALYLIYKTTKKQKVNNQQFIIERWTPETVQESPQSRYIIGNLRHKITNVISSSAYDQKKIYRYFIYVK